MSSVMSLNVFLLGDIRLTPEDFARAQKYCKYAGSALQYEDVGTAVQNLQKALRLLTTGREWSLWPGSHVFALSRTNSHHTFLSLSGAWFDRRLQFYWVRQWPLCVSDSWGSILQLPQPVVIVQWVDPLISEYKSWS